jgi:hypothetical protein
MKRKQRICIEQTFKQLIYIDDTQRDGVIEQVSAKDPTAGNSLNQLLTALRGNDAHLEGPLADLYKRLANRFVRC